MYENYYMSQNTNFIPNNTMQAGNQFQQAPVSYVQPQPQQQQQPQSMPMQTQVYPTAQPTQQVPLAQPVQQVEDIPHPKEFWFRKNSDYCLYVDNNLDSPSNADYINNKGDKLLMELHSNFSKFKFNIFQYKSKETLSFNIEPSKLAGLEKKTEAIYVMDLNTKSSENSLTPAYTVALASGKFKGRTPARIILETPELIPELQQQAEFLYKNLNKYKNNARQLEAINDAFTLYNQNALTKENCFNPISLYSAIKMPHALNRDANGFTKVIAANITYNPSANNPINISIMNGLVQPLFKTDKTSNADMSTLKNNETYEFNLALDDWSDLLAEMRESKVEFERVNRTKRRTFAHNIYMQQRTQASMNKK